MLRAAIVSVILGVGLAQFALATEPSLQVVRDKSGHAVAFEASGLPEEQLAKLGAEALADLLAVYVVDQQAKDPPPTLGKYEIDGDSLRFTPRYALRAGTRYKAVLQPAVLAGKKGEAGSAVTLEIALPAAKSTVPTVITQIYPTSDKLPENQLRFYLHFSQPMSRGEAYSHLKLLKEDGKPVELPFLELGEELWDSSGKRLTLLIDPGRVKRGLKPREDVGPVLEEGHKYTLVVDASWKDASGEPLKAGFEKKFAVEKPIEAGIDTAAWKLELPPAGSKQPLVLKFPRPLDHALLERTISVLDASGQPVAGSVEVAKEERQWSLSPQKAWTSGEYSLEVDKVLEDPAGNRIGRPFELAEGETVKQKGPEKVRIPFSIMAARAAP